MNTKKINVLILMCQIETFQGLQNLYHYFKSNDIFNVNIIHYDMVLRTRRRWIHNIKASDELKKKNIEFIQYRGGGLQYLNPDYVFYATPYNIQYPKSLNISKVKAYSKICYFGYGYNIWDCRFKALRFIQNVDFHFMENELYYNDFFKHLEKNRKKISIFRKHSFITGHPKVSSIKFKEELKYINFGWTPRWDPKTSTFELYFDFLTQYFNKNENINLSCRFHPLDKNISRKTFLKNIEKNKNINIHNQLYYDKYFENLDVLISDLSTMIAEFFPTGKPIIFCNSSNIGLGSFGNEILKGMYIVNNKKEMADTIEDLQNNIDPLKETRKKLIERFYKLYDPLKNISKILISDYNQKK